MEEKIERIYLRISLSEKEKYKIQAEKNNQTVSQFIREACLEKILKENNHGRETNRSL